MSNPSQDHAIDLQAHPTQKHIADTGTDTGTRQKVVRGGFSMPDKDYRLISEIRDGLLAMGVPVTKSEVLRAGLQALAKLPKESRLKIFEAQEPIRTGRPSSMGKK